MDFLNSQHLTSQDGYIHPFRKPGTFAYSALVSDFNEWTDSGIIIVSGAGSREGEGEQHDIVFSWDPERRRYLPREEDRKKAIGPNDFVVFQFDVALPGQPPCFILIESEEDRRDDADREERRKARPVGDSRRLQTHDAFSHFFLTPGEYIYSVGKTAARLIVGDHQKMSAREHEKQTQEPLVIMVNGTDLSMREAEIVSGQTVIWAVESGEDVTITLRHEK